MATLKTSTRYSAGDLFAMDEDARFELIEGELVEMTLPTHEHGKLVIDLGGEGVLPGFQLPLAELFEPD